MKIIKNGYRYELESPKGGKVQTIQFIQNELNEDGSSNVSQDGITTEEVLRVLIDRMKHLNKHLPLDENKDCLLHLQKALSSVAPLTTV